MGVCARFAHRSVDLKEDSDLGPLGCWVFKGTSEIGLGVWCLFAWARPWTPCLDKDSGAKELQAMAKLGSLGNRLGF